MTGATRFLQNNIKHPTWSYLKTEDPEVLDTEKFWESVDYAITADEVPRPGFHKVAAVKAYAGFKVVSLDDLADGIAMPFKWLWVPLEGVEGRVVDWPVGGRSISSLLGRWVPGKKCVVLRME